MAESPIISERASQVEIVDRQVELAKAEHGDGFDPTPLNALLLLHRVMATIGRAESWEFEAIAMTGTSFNIVMVLHRERSSIPMRELAEAVSLAPSNLTAVVSDLEQRGIVRRTASPSDRRVVEASITEKGEALLRGFLPGHWNLLDTLFGALGQPERQQLIDLLSRVLTVTTDRQGPRGLSADVVQAISHEPDDDEGVDTGTGTP